jgi:nucleoside 2-deoxyribosyltransferase
MGMRDLPLVYIAGPYTHPDPIENTRRAIEVADVLADMGAVVPHVPHLTLLWQLVRPHEVDWWHEYDLAILARCDALLRLDGASTGADAEVEFAASREIPVFFSAAALHQAARDGRLD